jgi:hypothetical protein
VLGVKEHPEEDSRRFLEEVDIHYKATRRHSPEKEYYDPHSLDGSVFHICGSRINYAPYPRRTPWVHSLKTADSAIPLDTNLAYCEIDGNTGTRPWKVNKTRNMRFWYLLTNMKFGEIGGESNARDYFQARSVNGLNRSLMFKLGGFHSADVSVQVF